MLNNSLRKAVTTISKRSFQRNLGRCLATAPPSDATSDETKAAKKTAPRDLPLRHSRHLPAQVASEDILDSSVEKLLTAMPGTLFSYNPKNLNMTQSDEYENALSECHALQQKVEYLMRGYSSMLEGSMTKSENSYAENKDEIIDNMIELLERMEAEGKAYVEVRSKYRSQLARVADNTDSGENESDAATGDKEDSIDEDTDVDAWKMTALVNNYGAPPGPSNTMYDLVLDAIAVSIESSKDPVPLLEKSRAIYNRSLERYELDAKSGFDQLNPSSCPTTATFNAVIRTSANISSKGDDAQIRDHAMENAFFAFDGMLHHPVVPRNSATYRYMLNMIGGLFPVGEIRGNFIRVVWEKAIQDGVLDLELFDTVQQVADEQHGELFDTWWKNTKSKFVKDVNGYGFQISWGKNKNTRRFERSSATY